jgi:phosphonate transport system substrate-binding protein
MLRKLILGTVAAVVLATSPVAAQEVNFGIISTEASVNLKKLWDPFLADMAKGTGLKINAFFASDYAGIIEGMRFNKVQVAWYGNKSAMEAVDRAEGEVFAQTIAKDGTLGYYSHILVHKDSPYQQLDDILKCDKTLDFGIGDPNSTSGFLVPTTFIFAAKNIDPKNCFKTVRNANHEANALAVANKLVAAAANNSENLERIEKTNPEAHKNLRVIWTSPLIPSDPLVWRKDLDPAVKEKLSGWLLSYGKTGKAEVDAPAKEILTALQWQGFKKSDNSQLLAVRQMEVNKSIMKVKGDEKLSEDEKKAKLVELDAKAADIAKQIAEKK